MLTPLLAPGISIFTRTFCLQKIVLIVARALFARSAPQLLRIIPVKQIKPTSFAFFRTFYYFPPAYFFYEESVQKAELSGFSVASAVFQKSKLKSAILSGLFA
jgi:hypothetical protein